MNNSKLILSLLLMLTTSCAVHHLASDPTPTLPSLANTATPPVVLEQKPSIAATEPPPPPTISSAPVALLKPALTTPKSVPALTSVLKPKESSSNVKPKLWGLVAITTDVISPSQLMGPKVDISTSFKTLPVFPEKVVMNVSWGLLSVGEATLTVDQLVIFNGRPAYHLVSEARSNSFCDAFYPVRDLNESWLDAQTLTSLGYSKKLREGNFFRDEWVLYDRDAQTFVARRTNRDGTYVIRTGTIPVNVQDVLSSIYYTRAQTLKEGGEVTVDVNTPDNWPLVVKVVKNESISVTPGRFASVLVEPAMRREGLFIQKGKRLQLWLSDDAFHRPLLMKVEVFFGHVTASLREML